MSDPVYINAGDEFDIEDNSWRYIDDLENQEVIKEVFSICGSRKYFASEKEGRKWRKIDGQLARGAISKDWVANCVNWARKKNLRVCAIKVEALGNLILNKARMQDWLMENKEALRLTETYKFEDNYDGR